MQDEIVNGIEICGDCGVEKHGIVFKTKHDHTLRRSSSADFIKTRVCKHCDRGNCINRSGKIDKQFDVKL